MTEDANACLDKQLVDDIELLANGFHDQRIDRACCHALHAATATVFQFPIKLAFAITGHKMQGQTIKKGSQVVVNWSRRMPPALAYMMLSRTETLGDLFIAGDFDPKR